MPLLQYLLRNLSSFDDLEIVDGINVTEDNLELIRIAHDFS